MTTQEDGLKKLIASIPTADLFSYFTGEDAMERLCALLPAARLVNNTRILSPKMSITSHSTESPWDLTIRKSVQSGLAFREVVSIDNEPLARTRRAQCAGSRGTYDVTVLRHNLPSFMNFVVLEYVDGAREVWFGWVVSRNSGFEGTVIRTSEIRIVTLFERWHRELFAAGQTLK